MDEQFYVRIRGRVQGPYDQAKLQSLVRRGQLSRMHEVSTDRSLWKQAADYPELFATPTVGQATVTASRNESSSSDDELELEKSPADSAQWYYALNQDQKGPVTFEQLKGLLNGGVLSGGSLVWKEGMPEWSPAETLSDLRGFTSSGRHRREDSADGTTAIDSDTFRTLKETIPWVGFLVVCLMTVCCLMAISGVVLVLMGVRERATRVTASGLFFLVYAFVGIWGGLLLNGYNGNIRKFVASKSPEKLEAAFRSLKSMWTYISIILIIVLVNAVFLAIWAFSVGLTLT